MFYSTKVSLQSLTITVHVFIYFPLVTFGSEIQAIVQWIEHLLRMQADKYLIPSTRSDALIPPRTFSEVRSKH